MIIESLCCRIRVASSATSRQGYPWRDVADDATRVRQHKLSIIIRTQASDPRIKQLHHLRARCDLCVQVLRKTSRDQSQESLPGTGVVVHQACGVDVVLRTAAFDYVRSECKRCAAEADQRNVRTQGTASLTDCFVNKLQGAHVFKFKESINVCGFANGIVNDGSFAGGKLQLDAHWFDDQQDVGKDDGGIDAEPLDGCHGYFSGELGRLAKFKKRRL